MVSKPHLRVLLWTLSSESCFCFGNFECTTLLHPKMWIFEFPEARIGIDIVLTLGSQIYTYYDVL